MQMVMYLDKVDCVCEEFGGFEQRQRCPNKQSQVVAGFVFPNIHYLTKSCNLGILKSSQHSHCVVWTVNSDLITICIPASLPLDGICRAEAIFASDAIHDKRQFMTEPQAYEYACIRNPDKDYLDRWTQK